MANLILGLAFFCLCYWLAIFVFKSVKTLLLISGITIITFIFILGCSFRILYELYKKDSSFKRSFHNFLLRVINYDFWMRNIFRKEWLLTLKNLLFLVGIITEDILYPGDLIDKESLVLNHAKYQSAGNSSFRL